MSQAYDLQPLIEAVVDGEVEEAIELVSKALDNGVGAQKLVEQGLVEGMKIVSDKYDAKEYFVPDLAAAADAMNEALEMLKPLLEANTEDSKGTIVIGVVQDCSQEVGKNIVSAMLSGAGFDVYDLGINVSPQDFVDKAKEVDANIIAMGSPMLQTVKYFTDTHELLISEGMREKVKLLIGGASTNKDTVAKTGVDAWAKDGREAIEVSLELMKGLK